MKNRILLPNGCSCSNPSVNPKNWKTCTKSALEKNWQIQYYFYDPELPKPTHPTVIKGMNEYKNIIDRRNITATLLADELDSLINKGYNPRTRKFTVEPPPRILGPLNETLPIISAFRKAHEKLKATPDHLDQIRYAINRFEKASKKLRMAEIQIGEFRRREFKEILDSMNLPDSYYNKFKAYFSSLFVELIEYECCDTNITRDIKKRITVTKQREVLSLQAVDLVMAYLKDNYYNFYRYAKIFFYSGARSAELFSVQKKHVRLDMQEYDILLKKGSQYVWETKIIIQNAIPFWTEIMALSRSSDDFLFSYDLVPGLIKNNSNQITRRWRKLVKDRIVFKNGEVRYKAELDKVNDFDYERITADFYALKHGFLDLLDSMDNETFDDGFDTAQEMGGHRTPKVTHGVYTTGKVKRKNERLKKLRV